MHGLCRGCRTPIFTLYSLAMIQGLIWSLNTQVGDDLIEAGVAGMKPAEPVMWYIMEDQEERGWKWEWEEAWIYGTCGIYII